MRNGLVTSNENHRTSAISASVHFSTENLAPGSLLKGGMIMPWQRNTILSIATICWLSRSESSLMLSSTNTRHEMNTFALAAPNPHPLLNKQVSFSTAVVAAEEVG